MAAEALRPPDRLVPTDPPILIAGLIAARRTGDNFLASIYRRELETRHGIRIRFLAGPGQESEAARA